MSKQVKTVSMLLALSALSVGTVNAGTITSPNAVQKYRRMQNVRVSLSTLQVNQ